MKSGDRDVSDSDLGFVASSNVHAGDVRHVDDMNNLAGV